MKITVIGGSGFLGSHVADQLSEAGHSVTIFDIKQSPWLRDDQQMIVGDILDVVCLESAIANANAVYHFAALADLNDLVNKPVETVKVNVLGTVQILEICRKNEVKRFVYASTLYVYSREGGFYRCSKQASEHYIEEFAKTYGLEYTILRFGSLFGPRSNENNGLYRIVKNALTTRTIKLDKVNAEAIREYIHVEDAAKASVAILRDEFINESIVLTGHEPMRVEDVMKMLAEILGIPGNIDFPELINSKHYVRTPYAYQPKPGRKYTPELRIDLGQGLLQLINEIASEQPQ